VLHVVAAIVIGHSVQGRPLRAYEVGDPKSTEKVLVVGCIHGNEPAGIPVVTRLERSHPSFDLWLLPLANPDGCAHGTRQNAHGVDLNRNFPSNWARIGRPGSYQYSGPHSLSEPETRILVRFIRRLRPTISIWFHQHQNVVRAWGQSRATARRFARLARMRYASIRWPYGTASNWQNHAFPGTSSFVVELPAGRLSPSSVTRLANAVLRLAS
jgi:murein peptide amidase A